MYVVNSSCCIKQLLKGYFQFSCRFDHKLKVAISTYLKPALDVILDKLQMIEIWMQEWPGSDAIHVHGYIVEGISSMYSTGTLKVAPRESSLTKIPLQMLSREVSLTNIPLQIFPN